MIEEQRVNVIHNELTDLFELKRGSEFFENCPNYAFTTVNMKQWATVPGTIKGGRRIPAKCGYERMVNCLGKEDYFSFASSPRRFASTAWISCEWDMLDLTPDEHFLKYAVDDDLLMIISKTLNVHWKLTGNKSVHLDLFLTNPVERALATRFLDSARFLLVGGNKEKERVNVFGGRYDKTNLSQCMRLPLSRHQLTNKLCRYAGCHSEDDLLYYIKSIERDDLDSRAFEDLCQEMEAYLTNRPSVLLLLVDTLPPMQKADGIGGKITQTPHHGYSLPEGVCAPSDDKLAEWVDRGRRVRHQTCRKYLSKFLGYIEKGVPDTEFNNALFEGDGAFPLFLMIVIGVKAEAHAFMRYLACLNVSEEAKIRNRLGRVDYVFKKYFQYWEDCEGSFLPADMLKAFEWLVDFVNKMRDVLYERYRDRRKVNNLLQVMLY